MNPFSIFPLPIIAAVLACVGLTRGETTNILSLLKRSDEVLEPGGAGNTNVGYLVSFIMTSADHAQGTKVSACDVLWTNGFCLVSTASSYQHGPVFIPPSKSRYNANSYDSDGNLMLYRSIGKYIIFARDINNVREDFNVIRVKPDGTFSVSTNAYHVLYKYEVGNRNSIFEFDRFLLTMGRGFSPFIHKINSEGEDDTLGASGEYARSLKGSWMIRFERRSEYLVRSASFTADKAKKPTLEFNNSGNVECPGLSIASAGIFNGAGGLREEFQVVTLTNLYSVGATFTSYYEKTIKGMTSPPSGTLNVSDYRGPTIKSYRE